MNETNAEKIKKFLFDMKQACQKISDFTQDKTFENYGQEPMLRSAVERQFEILGEALNLLQKIAPDLVASIPEYRKIIAFRNRLIHGYANVSNEVVRGVMEHSLPLLRPVIDDLLLQKK